MTLCALLSRLRVKGEATADGTRHATKRHMTMYPLRPNQGEPKKREGVQPASSPVNPDPKAHPIHPKIPVQPIHEGTDPKRPVAPGDVIQGASLETEGRCLTLLRFSYRLIRDSDSRSFVAECVESDAAGEGKTAKGAVESLRSSLEERMFRPDAVAPPSRPTEGRIELVLADDDGQEERKSVDLGDGPRPPTQADLRR